MFNSWGFFVTLSMIYLLKNDTELPLALNSTDKCGNGPINHLLVGICTNGYPFLHLPVLLSEKGVQVISQ